MATSPLVGSMPVTSFLILCKLCLIFYFLKKYTFPFLQEVFPAGLYPMPKCPCSLIWRVALPQITPRSGKVTKEDLIMPLEVEWVDFTLRGSN